MMSRIGIIGGSGLYDLPGLEKIKRKQINTPFGPASDNFILADLEGQPIVFLARHGQGHKILPSEINYRANIYGLKQLGVERIISVSAVGSLKKEIRPRDFLLADQFVDRTNQARQTTFFGQGIVAHIAFAQPVCPQLSRIVFNAGQKLNLPIHARGTYLNMEGPAFSTRAESHLYRSWGMDVIGMTNMAEARLAREAEICYVTLAMVTDYDCWYSEEESVSADLILQNMQILVANTKKLIKTAISQIPASRDCLCTQALKNAIITPAEAIPARVKKDLAPIIGKYL